MEVSLIISVVFNPSVLGVEELVGTNHDPDAGQQVLQVEDAAHHEGETLEARADLHTD